LKKASTLKFNVVVGGLTLLLQLLLALSPFIRFTASFWKAGSPQEFYNNLTTFIGIQLVLVTGAVTLILLRGFQDQSSAFSEFRSAFPATIVRRLSESDFYNHFRCAVEEAQHSVRIAYLAPYPPTEVAYKHRKRYYEEILELMKRRTDLTFKRLVRASPKNDRWIADLLHELRDRPNVDIAMLTRDLPSECDLPLALSVQVIDDDKSWIVAIGSHEREGDFRDIYIENADLAKGLAEYYNRIWQVSDKLLDRGRLTTAGQALLQRTGSGQ
jgi:hypothetical protein